MINKSPPFKGLHIMRIPVVIPIKGRGFINQGSTLVSRNRGPNADPKYYSQYVDPPKR